MVSKSKRPIRQLTVLHELLTASCSTCDDDEILSHSLDVHPVVFGRKYGCQTLLKKVDASTEVSRLHDECQTAYLATEDRIRSVNSSIRTALGSGNSDARLKIFIEKVRRKVSAVIGEEPNLREFAAGCAWGPGATFSLKSVDATLDNKLIEPALSVTPKCLKYAVAYLSSSFLWMRARLGSDVEAVCSPLKSEFAVTHWGRFSSVPKTTVKRRPIDVQPTLNLFFQKGAGRMIRRKLRQNGINLDDQSRNQRLAEAAYVHGLATIDLEAASDSVSTELVRAVLPVKWFDLLNDLRTTMIDFEDGTYHSLRKFSSMGNGFTFELESLIFYSICHVVVRDMGQDSSSPIAVYGDDLIVSRQHYDSLVEHLTLLGFVINTDKSFKDGFFFESCGKHFYKGVDVTPVYQKTVPVTHVDWVRLANRLWRWAYRLGHGVTIDKAVRPAFDYCSEQAHKAWATQWHRKRSRRDFVPLPLQPFWLEGDDGLIADDPGFVYDKNGIARPFLLRHSPVKVEGCNAALYCEDLRVERSGDNEPSYGFVTPRGMVRELLARRRVYVQHTQAPEWA